MESIIVMAIMGLFSLIANAIETKISNSEQRAHDKEMAEIQKQNQKELMDYETEIATGTNTIATQKGHMAEAGFSPALMYGSMSPAGLMSTSGSASASASSLNPLKLFDKISPKDTADTILTSQYQKMQKENLEARNHLLRQQTLESAARTAEQTRYTGLQKTLQKTIVDQSLAELERTKWQGQNLKFLTERGMQLLPGELVAQGLINDQTAANIDRIHSEVLNNSLEYKRIQHDIRRIDSITSLNESSEALNREDSLRVQESVKSSAVGRIMQEFGLANRKLPSNLRSGSVLHQALNNEQMKGAYIELKNLGFSDHEAVNAVLYYCAVDPKDVTPSVVNGATRIFAAMVHK